MNLNVCIIFIILVGLTNCTIAARNLIWTDKGGGLYDIAGNPEIWIQNDNITVSSVNINGGNHFRTITSDSDDSVIFLYSPEYRSILSWKEQDLQNLGLRKCSHQVTSLAVDWVANNLYWTDSAFQWVMMVSERNMSLPRVIMDTGLKKPYDIVVYPQKSYLFVSDISIPSIVRTDLFGQSRKEIMSKKLGLEQPVSLTLDYASNRLYWLDTSLSTLKSTDLDGKDLDTMSDNPKVAGYISITMYENLLFAAHKLDPSIDVYDKSKQTFKTSVNVKDFVSDVITDIHMHAPERQIEAKSPCSVSKCYQICVGSNNNARAQCQCADGFSLAENGFDCIREGDLGSYAYVFATGSKICYMDVFDIYVYNQNVECISVDLGLSHISQIAYHWKTKKIIVLDRPSGTVKTYSMVERNVHTLIKGLEGNSGMTVDWSSPNGALFLLDGEKGILRMTSLDGTLRKTIRSDVTDSRHMDIDFRERSLYWVEGSQIMSSYMYGKTKKVFLEESNGHNPQHLKIDQSRTRLMWYDMNHKKFYHSSLASDKANPEVLLDQEISGLLGFDVFKSFLIWAQAGSKNIHVWNMETKSMENPIVTNDIQPSDVMAFANFLQVPDGYNSFCLHDGMACSHFCLDKRDSGHVCTCADGYELDDDGRKCTLVPDDGSTDNVMIYILAGTVAGIVVIIVVIITAVCVVRKRNKRRARQRSDSVGTLLAPYPSAGVHRPSLDGFMHENNTYYTPEPEVYDTIDESKVTNNDHYLTTQIPLPDYDNVRKSNVNPLPEAGNEYLMPVNRGTNPNIMPVSRGAQPNVYVIS